MDDRARTAVLEPAARADAAGSPDEASVDGLTESVNAVLPALERFIRFDEPERTGRDRERWAAALREPVPEEGVGAEGVLELLADTVVPNGLRAGAPGFSGWVATMPTTLPVTARLASALAGPLAVGIQSFNLLEELALEWLRDALGIPSTYRGLFTSGGSVANLIGLGAARQHAGERLGLDPAREGVQLPRPRIYASSEIHHCVYRAAAVLGLGRSAVVTLPTHDALRLDVRALRDRLEADLAAGCTPIAVAATAGTINSGAIDPLPEISAVCREHDVWLHVDGAYGFFGVLDPEVRPLYGSLEDLDSIVVDPHKWLATSMGCGGLFVRDGSILGRAFTLLPAVYAEDSQPIYGTDAEIASQFDDFGYTFHHLGVEHSLPSRGVEVWAVLKEIGTRGLAERIVRHNRYARHLAQLVEASPKLELAAPVTLSTCCYRFVPPALRGRTDPAAKETLNRLNREVLGRVRARGRAFPSATTIDGAFVIRPCFINPRTTLADVEAHAEDVERCGDEALAAMVAP